MQTAKCDYGLRVAHHESCSLTNYWSGFLPFTLHNLTLIPAREAHTVSLCSYFRIWFGYPTGGMYSVWKGVLAVLATLYCERKLRRSPE